MSRLAEQTKTIVGDIVRRTEQAIRFKFKDEDDIERIEWFPLSQVDEIHNTIPARIVVRAWLYNKKEAEWANQDSGESDAS